MDARLCRALMRAVCDRGLAYWRGRKVPIKVMQDTILPHPE